MADPATPADGGRGGHTARGRGQGPAGADLGLRQDRDRGLRPRARAPWRRDRLHGRDRIRAARGGHRGARRVRADGLPGDPQRPGEDASPAAARGAPGGARRPGAHADAGGRGHRSDRSGVREPLPVRAHGGQAGSERCRRDREHRHRWPDDDSRGGQEPRLGRRRGAARELRRGASRARGDRRQRLRSDEALARQRGIRLHRPLRRGDQPLVRCPLRGVSRSTG